VTRTLQAVLFLFALLALPRSVLAEQEVRFSTDVPFVVQASGTGIVSRSGDTLSVYLDLVTLVTPAIEWPVTVRSIRIGVAFEDPQVGQWNVSHWSEPVEVNRELQPNDLLELKGIPVTIRIGERTALKGRWLLIQVNNSHPRSPRSSTYAHSKRTLFDNQPY
jgi:hypothetical protein